MTETQKAALPRELLLLWESRAAKWVEYQRRNPERMERWGKSA